MTAAHENRAPSVEELITSLDPFSAPSTPAPEEGLEQPDLPEGQEPVFPWRGFRAGGVARYLSGLVDGVGAVAAGKVGRAVEEARGVSLADVIRVAGTQVSPKQAEAIRVALTLDWKEGGNRPWFHEASMFALSAGLDRKQASNMAWELRQKIRTTLVADPYPVLLGVSGIGWEAADPAAQAR